MYFYAIFRRNLSLSLVILLYRNLEPRRLILIFNNKKSIHFILQ